MAGQPVVLKVRRETDGRLVGRDAGTLYLPGFSKDPSGLETVRTVLRSRDPSALASLRVYRNPPPSLWEATMAYPDARIRTGREDAEWIEFWPWILRDREPVTIDRFVAGRK